MEGVVQTDKPKGSIRIIIDNCFTHTLSSESVGNYVSLVTPRPAIDTTAMQEEMVAWDRRASEYDANTPKPPKPEAKESTDYAVAVG